MDWIIGIYKSNLGSRLGRKAMEIPGHPTREALEIPRRSVREDLEIPGRPLEYPSMLLP